MGRLLIGGTYELDFLVQSATDAEISRDRHLSEPVSNATCADIPEYPPTDGDGAADG